MAASGVPRRQRIEKIAFRYKRFSHRPFPRGWAGRDVAGVCLVMANSTVAGCVSTWLSRDGELDDERWDRLSEALEHLDRVVPVLSAEPHAGRYFKEIRDIGLLVWECDLDI